MMYYIREIYEKVLNQQLHMVLERNAYDDNKLNSIRRNIVVPPFINTKLIQCFNTTTTSRLSFLLTLCIRVTNISRLHNGI